MQAGDHRLEPGRVHCTYEAAAYADLHASLGNLDEARAYLDRALAHQASGARAARGGDGASPAYPSPVGSFPRSSPVSLAALVSR